MALGIVLLGLILIVLAVVGLLVARTVRSQRRASPPRTTAYTREPPRQGTRKSSLTIMSELAGIVGVIIAIIGLLVR